MLYKLQVVLVLLMFLYVIRQLQLIFGKLEEIQENFGRPLSFT